MKQFSTASTAFVLFVSLLISPFWAQTAPGDAFEQTAKLTAADGAAVDFFGRSVAISGDTAIVGSNQDDVGANGDQGSAYIFVRSGTTWSQQQKLTASDGAATDIFGYSVAIFGETAIVGAPPDDVGANTDQGSAYIFVRSGTTWSQQQKLTAADGAANDSFGGSVAISGETAIVGALNDDVGANVNQGSAYIFVRSGTTWSQQQKLTASDGSTSDEFGDVAISGETAIVGANRDDVGANTDQGSAYVFVRSGTTWSEQQKLTAADGAAGDRLGYSVAIPGETAIVGAPTDDVGANTNQGSACVFVRSGTTWSEQQKLTAADGETSDQFGFSVDISGETAIVGANVDDVGANNQGSAYIFLRSGTTWSQQQKLTASDGAEFDNFGTDVAISGETPIVGSPFNSVGPNFGQGSAYVFRVILKAPFDFDGDGKTDIGIFRPSNGTWFVLKSQTGTAEQFQFGASGDVPLDADFDGDGKADFSVWRPSDGTWHYRRSSDGTFGGARWGASGDRVVAGDYDADGKTDFAVWRPSDGINYIVLSSASFLGVQWGGAGDIPAHTDLNNDGKTDFAVFRPSTGTWYTLVNGTTTNEALQFGQSGDIPVKADFDGDRKGDIAVWRPSTGEWFYRRSSNGTFGGAQWGANGDRPVPGDYDGDGKTDFGVWRSTDGIHYIVLSSASFLGAQWGGAGDIPVLGAPLP